MDNVHLLEVDNLRTETMAGVNSHFAAVIEEEILEMLTFLECFVLSEFVYPNTIISSISGRRIVAFRIFISMLCMSVNILPLFTETEGNNY